MHGTLAKFCVVISDNFHFMDASERIEHGSYPTLDAAIAACRKIIDEDLASMFKPGMTAKELYELYHYFGDDPFVVIPQGEPHCEWSAWEYAKHRASEICAAP